MALASYLFHLLNHAQQRRIIKNQNKAYCHKTSCVSTLKQTMWRPTSRRTQWWLSAELYRRRSETDHRRWVARTTSAQSHDMCNQSPTTTDTHGSHSHDTHDSTGSRPTHTAPLALTATTHTATLTTSQYILQSLLSNNYCSYYYFEFNENISY